MDLPWRNSMRPFLLKGGVTMDSRIGLLRLLEIFRTETEDGLVLLRRDVISGS